jgi:omega-6 fatty acid desaturase (delta-12 desaturase)
MVTEAVVTIYWRSQDVGRRYPLVQTQNRRHEEHRGRHEIVAAGHETAGSRAIDPRELSRTLASYRRPSSSRSIFELTITLVPFLALLGAMFAALNAGYWLALLLVLPAGGLLLRLFLIQHDCGHGAFFPTRAANDWVGRSLALFTLTPYDCWRRSHALHHARTGNLDGRGFGDVDTLTVREFLTLSRWKQFLYRLYRHPLVLFGIGPAYLFLLRHRLPVGLMKEGRRYWISALTTNAATALLWALLIYLVGFTTFLIVLLPVTLTAASGGVWLFYVQHQFEDAVWDREESWTFHEAALHGSSHLDLPAVLRWFTANVGIHHVHHLASSIPYYRLPEVLRDNPQLHAVNRLTMWETFKTFRLALWDEDLRRMLPLSTLRRQASAS